MGLFGNKKKSKIEWTNKTAPEERKIQLNIKLELIGKSKTDSYGNDRNVAKVVAEKFLNATSDVSREIIKEEIQNKLENIYI
jgi:hypothetical protein